MSDPSSPPCPRCGAPIPAGATERLCPACLMSGALATVGTETVSLASAGRPSVWVEPKEFPCDFGGYRLHGLLGRGGMGTVYDAEEIATGRRVALKMLGQQLDVQEMRQRFLREGRLAAGVSHPHSLYIFGSEEIEGVPVITMEIAGSGTLKDKLQRRGPLAVPDAVDAILDVIAGLEAAFAAGVLHRDIKPSNCFVSPDGSVKIGDFGLSVSTVAKEDSYATATGVIMGTPAYASPEQLRGDTLDVRADIYSVGATLYTLLTDRAPFEGDNAVQVVANAVNQAPPSLRSLRSDVPPALERVVARCLAKEPEGRYADYAALRRALLPFSSKEPEPASISVRAAAGWIDFLLAFLPAYVILMLTVGSDGLLVRPLVERTIFSARYYLVLVACGLLYFAVAEGIWGAGVGKHFKGLRVVGRNGRPPGVVRALIRIAIPILCVEGVRMPLMMALITDAQWTGYETTVYVVGAIVCGWIPALFAIVARRDSGYATLWDFASGTRVVIEPEGSRGPATTTTAGHEAPVAAAQTLGPYAVIRELVPGEWILAIDPILRRQVWLRKRNSRELPLARRNLARPGRLRWLQHVETSTGRWDAFEAPAGVPLIDRLAGGRPVPWKLLRHWLHDLAAELWASTADHTLPAELSLDHIWVTHQGQAVLLDAPWPEAASPAIPMPVRDLAGQQRFLADVAARVESTSLPLHARPVLKNLRAGQFEKLSFLTGNLRGLLDRPADVGAGVRAGSIFVIPLFLWVAVLIGYYHDKPMPAATVWESAAWMVVHSAVPVLAVVALIQFAWLLLFRTTPGHTVFGLAVVNTDGERADRASLLWRWGIVWLPLLLPLLCLVPFITGTLAALPAIAFLTLLLLWGLAAVVSVARPHRGIHDRWAGTWVVRR